MATAMLAATLTHTLDALGVSGSRAPLTWPTNEEAQTGALLVAGSLMALTALAKAALSVSKVSGMPPVEHGVWRASLAEPQHLHAPLAVFAWVHTESQCAQSTRTWLRSTTFLTQGFTR